MMRSERKVRALRLISRAVAAAIVVGGLLVLLGWHYEIQGLRAIGPADVVMNPLVALLFTLTASVLLFNVNARPSRPVAVWSVACALIVFASGALVLLRGITGVDTGVDSLLFRDAVLRPTPPDWMAANTAVNFVLFGLALLTLRFRTAEGRRIAHWLVLPVAMFSLLVVIGYLYDTDRFITFQLQLPMALNTAVFFLAASFSLVAATPGAGIMALIAGDGASGSITRRLLPALLLVPLVLGSVINLGMRAGWYGATVSLALLTVATIMLTVLLTLSTAGALHRSEAALRQSEEHFRALIENSSDCVMIFDRQGSIRYVGPSVTRILGYEPDFVVGTRADALVHPDDAGNVNATIDALFRAPGETVPLEFRIRHRDGSWRVFESLGRTLSGEKGATTAVANARDITLHKQAEQAMLHAKEEAEKANRAKSEFLSRMSHELRTPMNSILGFAQLLELDDLTESQRRAVTRICKAGDHLLLLINEVLDLARIEANRLTLSVEPVQLNPLLRETLDLVRPIALQHDCRLSDVIPPEADCYVLADRQRLTQVLLNLVSNAIKYNRPGGSVRFLVRPLTGSSAEQRVAIGVWDNGPGIAPERMDELFTPFARLGAERSQVEGTGLGLSLSKRFVEAMGGSIRVDSVLDVGSTFWVELPPAVNRATQVLQDAPSSDALRREFALPARATILYVEDNLANLELVETILAAFPGIRLIPALQGKLAIELAREHHPDLILLDLHLPDIPGETVLQSLRADARTAAIPVLIVSADATQSRIRQLHDAGAYHYLTKPLDVRTFLAAVESMLCEPAVTQAPLTTHSPAGLQLSQ